ncbi:ER membrane protein complex subunit 2 isoform X1 [Rhinolophus sinicus]|uniref:ER membrane protein complex subunit 2 isoform X1 n=1 Tax=Rhinolophus sinicus TaxID=89399 RepID=UPI003D7AA077
MMTNPHNHLYCQQYAEVKYTQGGLENLELSRKYFSQALKLNNRNMRALFGLYMSASHIASNPKASAKTKKDNMKYASWAASQINRAYQHSISLIFREVRRESEEGDIIKFEERVFKKKVLCIRYGGEIKQTEISEKIMRLGRGIEGPVLGSRRCKAIFSGVKEICLFPTRLVFYVVSVVSYSFFSWYL